MTWTAFTRFSRTGINLRTERELWLAADGGRLVVLPWRNISAAQTLNLWLRPNYKHISVYISPPLNHCGTPDSAPKHFPHDLRGLQSCKIAQFPSWIAMWAIFHKYFPDRKQPFFVWFRIFSSGDHSWGSKVCLISGRTKTLNAGKLPASRHGL